MVWCGVRCGVCVVFSMLYIYLCVCLSLSLSLWNQSVTVASYGSLFVNELNSATAVYLRSPLSTLSSSSSPSLSPSLPLSLSIDQKALGMTLVAERASLSQVRDKFATLKRKKEEKQRGKIGM